MAREFFWLCSVNESIMFKIRQIHKWGADERFRETMSHIKKNDKLIFTYECEKIAAIYEVTSDIKTKLHSSVFLTYVKVEPIVDLDSPKILNKNIRSALKCRKDFSFLAAHKNAVIPIEESDFVLFYNYISEKENIGIPQLDSAIGGGVSSDSSILLNAPTCSEKSYIECMYIKEGLLKRQSVLVILFSSIKDFFDLLETLDVDYKSKIHEGMLKIIDVYSSLTEHISSTYEKNGITYSAKDVTSANIAINHAIETIKKSKVMRVFSQSIPYVFSVSKDTTLLFTNDIFKKIKDSGFMSFFSIEKGQDNIEYYDSALISELLPQFDTILDIYSEKEIVNDEIRLKRILNIKKAHNELKTDLVFPLILHDKSIFLGSIPSDAQKDDVDVYSIADALFDEIKLKFRKENLHFRSKNDYNSKTLLFWIHDELPRFLTSKNDQFTQKKAALEVFNVLYDIFTQKDGKKEDIAIQRSIHKDKKDLISPKKDVFEKIGQSKEEVTALVTPLLQKIKRDLGDDIFDFTSTSDERAKKIAKEVLTQLQFILKTDYDDATQKELVAFLFMEMCKKVKGETWFRSKK